MEQSRAWICPKMLKSINHSNLIVNRLFNLILRFILIILSIRSIAAYINYNFFGCQDEFYKTISGPVLLMQLASYIALQVALQMQDTNYISVGHILHHEFSQGKTRFFNVGQQLHRILCTRTPAASHFTQPIIRKFLYQALQVCIRIH